MYFYKIHSKAQFRLVIVVVIVVVVVVVVIVVVVVVVVIVVVGSADFFSSQPRSCSSQNREVTDSDNGREFTEMSFPEYLSTALFSRD